MYVKIMGDLAMHFFESCLKLTELRKAALTWENENISSKINIASEDKLDIIKIFQIIVNIFLKKFGSLYGAVLAFANLIKTSSNDTKISEVLNFIIHFIFSKDENDKTVLSSLI